MAAGVIWDCEGASVSTLTKYHLHRSLGAPIMMTNLYPFALGNTVLKHEKISHFLMFEFNTASPETFGRHCREVGVRHRRLACGQRFDLADLRV